MSGHDKGMLHASVRLAHPNRQPALSEIASLGHLPCAAATATHPILAAGHLIVTGGLAYRAQAVVARTPQMVSPIIALPYPAPPTHTLLSQPHATMRSYTGDHGAAQPGAKGRRTSLQ